MAEKNPRFDHESLYTSEARYSIFCRVFQTLCLIHLVVSVVTCMQEILEDKVEVKEKRLSKSIFHLLKDYVFGCFLWSVFARIQQQRSISSFLHYVVLHILQTLFVYLRYIRVHKDATTRCFKHNKNVSLEILRQKGQIIHLCRFKYILTRKFRKTRLKRLFKCMTVRSETFL